MANGASGHEGVRDGPGRAARPRRLARAIPVAALALGLMGFDSVDALHQLGGRWAGDGIVLTINPETMQGNADPGHPFELQPLVIRDVTGALVTFTLGQELCVAAITETGLDITLSRSPRTYHLVRERSGDPATSSTGFMSIINER